MKLLEEKYGNAEEEYRIRMILLELGIKIKQEQVQSIRQAN